MAEKRINLFGFELVTPEQEKKQPSPIPMEMDDGTELPVGGRIGYTYEQDAKYRNEHQLVKQYRDISFYPEADAAIDDIVNEAFVVEHERAPVSIRLDTLNIDDRIKKNIRDEFKNVLHLLRFQKKSYDHFRQWYVDGRLYFQVIIDKTQPKEGIKELRNIDALKIKRVVKPQYEKDRATGVPVLTEIKEWFEFSPDKNLQASAKLSKDSVVFCPSGLVDRNRGMIIGYLDKAIKPFNNLRSMEDALIVYRIARAPERRIFYVDVGQLPKIKAEQYIKDMMNRYRNKIDYDPSTGLIRDSRKFMSMLEDFWLPRRDGSKGTEITTLPGGTNLGDLADVEYFKGKLYQALNVPISRINQDNNFQLGRASDISRDELKFQKFIDRLRNRFSYLFYEILRKQLILKNVITEEDWNSWKAKVTVDYLRDNHFSELKEAELLREKIQSLDQISQYVGEYFSKEWVQKNVLMFDDQEIDNMNREIAAAQAQEPEDDQGVV